MINDIEVHLFKVLRSVVLKATGVNECILADQNAPAPKGDYATIRINDRAEETVRPQESYNTIDPKDSHSLLNFSLRTSLIADVHVNFYRSGAFSKASKLIGCTRIPSIADIITRAELGIMRIGEAINTTALQSDRTEERATITLKIAFERLYTEEVAPIKSVKFEITDSKNRKLNGETKCT